MINQDDLQRLFVRVRDRGCLPDWPMPGKGQWVLVRAGHDSGLVALRRIEADTCKRLASLPAPSGYVGRDLLAAFLVGLEGVRDLEGQATRAVRAEYVWNGSGKN